MHLLGRGSTTPLPSYIAGLLCRSTAQLSIHSVVQIFGSSSSSLSRRSLRNPVHLLSAVVFFKQTLDVFEIDAKPCCSWCFHQSSAQLSRGVLRHFTRHDFQVCAELGEHFLDGLSADRCRVDLKQSQLSSRCSPGVPAAAAHFAVRRVFSSFHGAVRGPRARPTRRPGVYSFSIRHACAEEGSFISAGTLCAVRSFDRWPTRAWVLMMYVFVLHVLLEATHVPCLRRAISQPLQHPRATDHFAFDVVFVRFNVHPLVLQTLDF